MAWVNIYWMLTMWQALFQFFGTFKCIESYETEADAAPPITREQIHRNWKQPLAASGEDVFY